MNEMLLITGVFDRLSGGNPSDKPTESEEYTLEDYVEILNEYKYGEAEILINIATINFEENHIRESLKNLEKAILIYKELEDIGKQALVLDLIGDINRYKTKNDVALDNYRKAYEFYTAVDSDLKDEVVEKIKELEVQQSAGEAQTIYNYGIPSEIPSEDSIEKVPPSNYNKISINIEEVIGLLNGADTYLSYAKSEDPMEALESAYEMSTGIGDDSGKATLLLIIGYVSLEKSKSYDALKYFNAAFENFQEIDDKKGEAVSRLLIGTTDYINGNMSKVSLNFRNAIEIFRELKDVPGENTAMKLINAIYEEE
jgi:tetratricopeptide (TPR) repeat protein